MRQTVARQPLCHPGASARSYGSRSRPSGGFPSGRAGFGFPELRFRMPVPARSRLQVSVDAAFRAANHVSQCAQALFSFDGDSGENGAPGRPYGLSRRVFWSWS